jgi:uncharacterized SAM-binding protein YcdF (DUF218 family)
MITLFGILLFQCLRPGPPPQLIFVLGGEPQRERFAAEFAQTHPGLPVWVSGGSNPEYAEWVFAEAKIDPQLVHLDYQAIDTLTNFTTLVNTFKEMGVKSVYLITSDYHMRRSRVIGQIVFGSHGIHLRPVAIPTEKSSESLSKSVFDGTRALIWLVTGDPHADLKSK